MFYVNLMFLAMAAMVAFLAFTLIHTWFQSIKAQRKFLQSSEPVPPRKRTISGQTSPREAALELNERMVVWQSLHSGTNRFSKAKHIPTPVPGMEQYRVAD